MSDGKGDEPEERKLGFYKIVSPLTSEPCGEWVSGIKKKSTRGSWASFGDQVDLRKEQKELRHDGPKVEGGGEGGMRLYWWVGPLSKPNPGITPDSWWGLEQWGEGWSQLETRNICPVLCHR